MRSIKQNPYLQALTVFVCAAYFQASLGLPLDLVTGALPFFATVAFLIFFRLRFPNRRPREVAPAHAPPDGVTLQGAARLMDEQRDTFDESGTGINGIPTMLLATIMDLVRRGLLVVTPPGQTFSWVPKAQPDDVASLNAYERLLLEGLEKAGDTSLVETSDWVSKAEGAVWEDMVRKGWRTDKSPHYDALTRLVLGALVIIFVLLYFKALIAAAAIAICTVSVIARFGRRTYTRQGETVISALYAYRAHLAKDLDRVKEGLRAGLITDAACYAVAIGLVSEKEVYAAVRAHLTSVKRT